MNQPVNIVGGFYRDDSLPWSAQDCVNWLPVPSERPGTRTPSKLRTPPGLRPLVEIGDNAIRGMENVEGALYVVSGTTMYRISTTGVAIPMGTIPGVGPVTMSYNQHGGGNQVLVTNGSSSGYVLNTASDTLTPISDDGYPGAIASDYIDSYLVQAEPFGRYWFWSNLADATDYNTLDRAEAEASPDKIVGLAVNQFEVVIFGQRTIEFFWNTGAATGTFQSKRVMANRGCASGRTIAKLGDALVWLGDDGIVYTLAGYQAVPLSTRALNDAIAGFNWSQAFAFVWEDRGHQVYYLTFPDGLTFGFDAASKEWHRRASFDMDRWRPNAVAKWNGRWVAGDFQAGRLYALDWDYMLEGADPIVSERVTGVLSADQDRVGIPEAEFLFDTGRGHETVPVAFPEQPDGPSISGEAPDGDEAVAYSFAYTTTAGGAPITRTTLRDTVLPDGWSWNELTATISASTPVPAGTLALKMRVYDTNGLYADHEDVFDILGTVRWDNATETGSNLSLLNDGTTVRAASNAAGFITADTSVSDGDWYWEATTGWYLKSGSLINHFGSNGIIRLSDDANGLVMSRVGETDDGGAVSSDGALFETQTLYAGWVPPENTPRTALIRNRLTFTDSEATWSVAVDDGEWTEIMSDKSGTFAPYACSRGTNQDPGITEKDVTIYSRPDDFTYGVPEGALPLGLAPKS